mmetsp:Transcript_28049/g.94466  ORF Transcript_28049/g.94466 Transcript_28049/m.94466 type:complete len:218 (-) Transcript_28049:18-671(-)
MRASSSGRSGLWSSVATTSAAVADVRRISRPRESPALAMKASYSRGAPSKRSRRRRPATTHVDPDWSRTTSGCSRSHASVCTNVCATFVSRTRGSLAKSAASVASRSFSGRWLCAASRAVIAPPCPSSTPKSAKDDDAAQSPSAPLFVPEVFMKCASSCSARQPCISATAPFHQCSPPRWMRMSSFGAEEIWPMARTRPAAASQTAARRQRGVTEAR